MIRRTDLRGTIACIGSFTEVAHKYFVGRLQCKSMDRRFFFSNQQSGMRIYMKLVMKMMMMMMIML
jgi:hypothetical protein